MFLGHFSEIKVFRNITAPWLGHASIFVYYAVVVTRQRLLTCPNIMSLLYCLWWNWTLSNPVDLTLDVLEKMLAIIA